MTIPYLQALTYENNVTNISNALMGYITHLHSNGNY